MNNTISKILNLEYLEYKEDFINSYKKTENIERYKGNTICSEVLENYTDKYVVQKEILKTDHVKGFELLLENLKKIPLNEYVCVELFEMSDYNYILFESKSKKKILGLLKMDKL